jgi:metallo-beta-lactamase class B
LANYLIATPQGLILINSDLEANVPMIRASVEQLGFKFADIKILLISHAHRDHDAGSALVKRLAGAKYMVMDADVPVVESGGKMYDVVIVGSPNVNTGYALVGNRLYPNIAQDYERTFRVLRSLPADIFLGAHGSYFNLDAKYARMKNGDAAAFIDHDGYKAYVDERENAFRTALAKEKR